MSKILYLPTRYFPSISGAEFYFQRIAEILSSKKECEIDIFCSEAIDFKALRNPQGKSIKPNEKYYNEVRNLKINRFPVDFNLTLEEKMENIKKITEFESEEIQKSSDIVDESFIRVDEKPESIENNEKSIEIEKIVEESSKEENSEEKEVTINEPDEEDFWKNWEKKMKSNDTK